jgi:hypothetical protein
MGTFFEFKENVAETMRNTIPNGCSLTRHRTPYPQAQHLSKTACEASQTESSTARSVGVMGTFRDIPR